MQIFISYSRSETKPFAIDLHQRLNQLPETKAWMDTKLQPSRSWEVQLEHQIKNCDKMIVLLSPDVRREETDSRPLSFVRNEIQFGKDHGKPIIPLLVKGEPIEATPISLTTLQRIDYRTDPIDGWQKLLECLEIENPSNISPIPILAQSNSFQSVVEASAMSTVDNTSQITQSLRDTLDAVFELPSQASEIYARLWQLNNWFKPMVYLELKAAYGDEWALKIKSSTADILLARNAEMTHIRTPALGSLSYSTLDDLCDIILADAALFDPYVTIPRSHWKNRFDEITHIQAEITSFRLGHASSLPKLLQFLRDIDHGVWQFCASYNSKWLYEFDPVLNVFPSFRDFAWLSNEGWSRGDVHIPRGLFDLHLKVSHRYWQQSPTLEIPIAGTKGYIYDATFFGIDHHIFDQENFLRASHRLHSHLIYITLDSFSRKIRVTISAVLGEDTVIDILAQLMNAAYHTVYRDTKFEGLWGDVYEHAVERETQRIQTIVDGWPQYVLEPNQLLNILRSDMPSSIFNA